MAKAKVILLCTLAAISYGIVHDQITAHLCVEYFTIAHPPLFHTESPTMLGFCWGIAATIGIGVVLGAVLAEVSQSQGSPPYPISRLGRRLVVLLGVMGLMAFLSGLLGFQLSRHSVVSLPATLEYQIPPDRHDRFMAVWFAHCASYLFGLAGGGFLIFRIWLERGKPKILALAPDTVTGKARALAIIALAALILYWRFARP
jgi:hypothetical protein